MKIIRGLFKLIIVAVLGLAGYGVAAESHYRIERSRSIGAPRETVWKRVGELREWEAWSPWKAMDSTAVNTYEGPPSGPGSVMKWKGERSGSGSVTVNDTFPPTYIRYTLHFHDWDSKSEGEIALQSEGAGTKVTWSMEGEKDFVAKIMWLLFGIEKALVRDFDDGLARLDRLVKG